MESLFYFFGFVVLAVIGLIIMVFGPLGGLILGLLMLVACFTPLIEGLAALMVGGFAVLLMFLSLFVIE
jgi:hypothetical protein